MTDPDSGHVALFSTGGTIAFVPGSGDIEASFSAPAAELLGSGTGPEVRQIAFRRLPSADLTVADVLELAAAIEAAAAEGAAGAVVSQGTDTLEETAYLLDLLVGSDIPVVVTGAMRNASTPGADGPANLDAAVRVAASPLALGLGVLVVFGDELHLARFVRKTHSSRPAAFTSSGVGPVGWVSEGRVRIPLVPRRRTPRIELPDGAQIPAVALLRAGLDSAPGSYSWPVETGCAGAVVEVFGAGHLSSGSMSEIGELSARMPVVFCSRTGTGETFTGSGATYSGSESDLLDRGLIPAGALDGPKARLHLALLLAIGADRAAIAQSLAATVQ
jgi:L-asparaginase